MVGPINPDVNPTDPTHKVPGADRDKPSTGKEDLERGQRQFSLPTEQAGQTEGAQNVSEPSPMDLARESAKQEQSPEELSKEIQGQITKVNESLEKANTQLRDPSVQSELTPDHYTAFTKVANSIQGDLRTVAKYTGTEVSTPEKKKGDNPLSFLLNLVQGSQGGFQQALGALSQQKNPTITQLYSIQFAVQRASQKAELLASSISAGVGAIKSIMAMQLG